MKEKIKVVIGIDDCTGEFYLDFLDYPSDIDDDDDDDEVVAEITEEEKYIVDMYKLYSLKYYELCKKLYNDKVE